MKTPSFRVRHDEDGQIGGIEGAIFGVLIFVLGTLLVANTWGVIDAKLAASSAAREAARTYAEATTAGSGDAWTAAREAARDAIEGHGRDWSRAAVEPPADQPGRCRRFTVEVRYEVPLVAVPLLGQHGRGIEVTARHSEIIDPYRSGPAGVATCSE
ncbi:MAG TPA: hypothetical protein VMZ73_00620 [Acidimicrobiales bacterium]|nr:hypothetical protein [Acidimicrobiales bacterium]